jgi:hypothetical protein
MRAILSGSMSGSFAYVLKRKFHLVGPKSEEKQDTDDYTCQGPSNGIFGPWSHDQLPKMDKNESCSPELQLPESVGILSQSAPVVEI